MDSIYTITDFDPFTAGPKAWAGYARLFAIDAANSSDLNKLQLTTREKFTRRHTRCKLICRGSTPVLSIQYQPATPPVIDFAPHLPAPSRVLSPHITAAIAQLMQDSDATYFLTTTKDPALQQILKNLHGVIINEIQYFQLHKDAATQSNIDRWLNNQEVASSALTSGTLADSPLTLSMHDFVPEHLYAPVAALMTELMNDIIRSDNQQQFAETAAGLQQKMTLFKKTGVSMPLFLLSDRQGQLAGLSFVLVSPGSAIAKQELTGIIRPYRGRQLACYLKALAVREIFRRYPRIETLETNCYSANQPIIHINQSMGYTLSGSALQFRIHTSEIHP